MMIQILKSLGFNAVRLGLMWPGIEPKQGEYNYTYLQTVGNIVNKLYQNDIYTILDFHQDTLSSKLCGEGAPDWYINNTFNFPFPLTEGNCNNHTWYNYQFTYTTNYWYENLYNNPEPLIKLWDVISNFYKDYNLLGYDLFNEPWPGNIYDHPSLLDSTVADKKLLQFYEKIINSIRKNDPYVILMVESVTWAIHVNFPSLPYNVILSYHCYDPPQLNLEHCIVNRIEDAQKLNTSLFLTEYMDLSLVNLTRKYKTSWTMWAYKSFYNITGDYNGFFYPNGTQTNIPYNLYQMFPRSICGKLNIWNESFISYQHNPFCSALTEIFLAKKKVSFINSGYYILNNILYMDHLFSYKDINIRFV